MKVYITGAKRSAIGSFSGSLSKLSAGKIGSEVLKDLIKASKTPVGKIDEVLVGQVLPANQGQGVGRQISIYAGIPNEVPASTLNMVCGSGMKSVMNAYMGIKSGYQNIVVAGGVEVMSQAPFMITDRNGIKDFNGDNEVNDHMVYDSLTDVFTNTHMGITAENIAEKFNMTREAIDKLAMQSQLRAIKADDANKFVDEISPITIKTDKGDVIFKKDEYIRRDTSLEKLAKLKPAFKKDGLVTAGSSSGINDGASFVITASEKAVKEYNLKPLVEIVSIAQVGVDPKFMGLAPVPAIKKALDQANLKLSDMDLMEINESFAAQSMGVIKGLSKDHNMTEDEINDITNVNGGSIALGHPVGASGNRIIVTLIHEMLKNKEAKYGLASLCIGGGMGTAIIVKKV